MFAKKDTRWSMADALQLAQRKWYSTLSSIDVSAKKVSDLLAIFVESVLQVLSQIHKLSNAKDAVQTKF